MVMCPVVGVLKVDGGLSARASACWLLGTCKINPTATNVIGAHAFYPHSSAGQGLGGVTTSAYAPQPRREGGSAEVGGCWGAWVGQIGA
jgi:hypothetical protein